MIIFNDLFGFGDQAVVIGDIVDNAAMSRASNAAQSGQYQALLARQGMQCALPNIAPYAALNALAPKLTEVERTARAGSPWMDLA